MNTRLAFNSIILPPKDNQNQFKENSLKVIYKIKNELKKIFDDKRVVTKILKMDGNKQYGNAMIKPLSTGNIKKANKIPTMQEFDLILQTISDTDKTGHLFIVDIEFDKENPTEKLLFFNENYTPIFEKQKVFCKRKVRISTPLNKKTHATMDKKINIPLYAKHIHLSITKCGWQVIRVRSHYTFE